MLNKASAIATYSGGGTAFVSGLTANEIGIYGGLIIGAAGFLLNWWYKRRLLALAERKGVSMETGQ